MNEYVPTTDEVRDSWRFAYPGKAVQFDRWLVEHDHALAAQVAEQIAAAILATDPVEWALAGQASGIVAAEIAREAVR